MLVIAGGPGPPVGLAGIMGGATTELSETPTTVALEVANWNPANIRRTSTRLGLRSEASTRFEKGLPLYLPPLAADRAAALMAELGGGTVARGLIDVGEVREERRTIVLPASEPRRLLGMDVDRTQIAESLSPLGFAVQTTMPGAPEALAATVPPWREDVAEAADLVEDIARMIGYDKVPETMLRGGVPAREVDRGFYWWRRLRPFLLACGLSEATNHSLTGDARLARLRAPDALEAGPLSEDEIAALVPNTAAVTAAGATYGPLRVQNPMAPDRATLRPTLMAGLLDNLSLNLRHGAESVRFFELGRAYFPHVFQAPDPARQPALERRTLGIALAGLRGERSWDGPNVALDFFDLKGIAEELLAYCGVESYVVEPAGHPVLHPARAAHLA